MKVDIIKAFAEAGINDGDVFQVENDPCKYKIENGKIMSTRNSTEEFYPLGINRFAEREIEIISKAPWRPEEGELFFIEDPLSEYGWDMHSWYEEYHSEKVFDRTPLFRTIAEVEAHVRAKGWI